MGLLDGIVKKKVQPTELEQIRREREEKEKQAWKYLRATIDRGQAQYTVYGQTTELEKVLSDDLLMQMCEQLEDYRASNVRWDFRTRYQSDTEPLASRAVIDIVSEDLDKDGRPKGFTVREYFTDNSRLVGPDDTIIGASDGQRLGVVGKVVYEGAAKYRLVSIKSIPGV